MILRVLVLTTTLSLCCNYTKIHTCGLDMKEKKSLVQINLFFTFCLKVNVCLFFSWPFCNDINSKFEFGISNLSLNRDVRGARTREGGGGPSRNGRSVNLILTEGGRLFPPHYYSPPQIFRPSAIPEYNIG